MPKRTLHLRFTTPTGDHRALGPFLKRALPTYEAPPGIRVRLLRSIEQPARYIEIIEYETLEAFQHDEKRLTDDATMKSLIQEWRGLIAGDLEVEAYEDVTGELRD